MYKVLISCFLRPKWIGSLCWFFSSIFDFYISNIVFHFLLLLFSFICQFFAEFIHAKDKNLFTSGFLNINLWCWCHFWQKKKYRINQIFPHTMTTTVILAELHNHLLFLTDTIDISASNIHVCLFYCYKHKKWSFI